MVRLSALAVSIVTTWWTVAVFRGGGRWSAPVVSYSILIALIVVSLLPRCRSFAGGPVVFAAAAFVMAMADDAVASRGAARWMVDAGLEWTIALTIFVLAALFEIGLPSSAGARIHAASAVAAAAFMTVPTIGTDVITTYDSQTPSLAAAVLVALAPGVWLVPSRPAWNQLLRLVEPALVVLLGWAAAYSISRGDVYARDLHWLLPLFALPASAAALVGAGKSVGARW